MNIKEFTLQKGFGLPILKALSILSKPSCLKDITYCMSSQSLFVSHEGDMEAIDFNSKVRFENAVEYCIEALVKQGLVSVSNNLYTITQAGSEKLASEWPTYNQNDYVRKIDIGNKNKYTYFNIPPYLLYTGQKQVSVGGFKGHEHEYVKFLNDFSDYIDLNYPTMEEMINFLKYNYDFEDNNVCLDAVNIIRTTGLAKVMGKNLSLTKLGQWYINSYDYIALFKIFANRYTGFEEIFNTVASARSISIQELKQSLSSKFDLSLPSDEQFDIRMNWLENLELISKENDNINLSNESMELAEFLGILDIDESQRAKQKVVVPSHTEAENAQEVIENVMNEMDQEDFDFSCELDNIVEDMVSDNLQDTNPTPVEEFSFDEDFSFSEPAKVEEPAGVQIDVAKEDEADDRAVFVFDGLDEPNIGQENILLDESIDAENVELHQIVLEETAVSQPQIEEEFVFDFVEEIMSEPTVKEVVEKTSKHPHVVVQMPTMVEDQSFEEPKKVSAPLPNMYIDPSEIENLINLPKDITSKIASALNMGKHIVLTGSHGSGKTSVAVVLAKLAQQKGLNNGYNLAPASENWTSLDTVGELVETESGRKVFKEGVVLKSISENKWLIVDEISKCDTYKCFNDFVNTLYGYNAVLSYMHENYKNIEIISEQSGKDYDINQYIKSKDWRMIATMDTSEKHHMNFSPAFIRRFAFIEIGVDNYSKLIDDYFAKHQLENDLLKSKIKTIFSQDGILKYKDVGASSIHDLIQYISIRNSIIGDDENMHDILAEGLELFVLPQLRILDSKIIKNVEEYLLDLFDGYEEIKESISNAL